MGSLLTLYIVEGIIGLVTTLSTVLPFSKADAITRQEILNVNQRPNVLSSNYYGSGDVNDDGKVDSLDWQLVKRWELCKS